MKSRRQNKSKIRQVLHSVKEKVREKISFPYLLFFAILALIFALFVLGIKIPFGDEGPSAIIDNRAIRFLNLYYGIVNITINNKTLENGVWKLNINGYSTDGIVNIDLWMNANDFTINKVSQNLVIPSEPSTIRKTGKEIGCSVGDKKTVDIYIDPYDPWSIKYDSEIKKFIQTFNEDIRLNYRILSTYTYKYISENANSPAYTALLYYECAKDKDYFNEFKSCVINRYNEKKDFLSEDELLMCIQQNGGDIDVIKKCVNDDYPKGELRTDERFAETFIGKPTTPMIVVDCMYIIYPAYINNAYCYLYPKLEQCKGE
ncbi:MAG: hypothetical protein QXO35_03680 [Candidatus Micrarchaeia archaeon]